MSYSLGAQDFTIKELLALKYAGAISENINSHHFTSDDYHYEIEIKDNVLEALNIHFYNLKYSKNLLSLDSSGYCLIQPRLGNVIDHRLFFFDENLSRKYELNSKGKVIAITLADLSQADSNKKCRAKDLLTSRNEGDVLKKVR